MILWRHEHKSAYDIHAVSSVYSNGLIYITRGYWEERDEIPKVSPDDRVLSKKWTDGTLNFSHGGVIELDVYIYGDSDKNSRNNWIFFDLKTGNVMAEISRVGKGSITYSDGMFYTYGENGSVGLIKASPHDFELVSSFKIDIGSQGHWACPTVAHGRLYIRHGNAIMAYDVTAHR